MADPRCIIQTGPLSDERKRQAKDELRETPENVQNGLAKLRELIAADKTLNFGNTDAHLIRFLRPTKYYPESALALMKRAAEFKVKHKEHVANLMPQDEKAAMTENNVVNILVDRDQNGRRILIIQVGEKWDPKKVTADQKFRMLYLCHVAALLEEETQVSGVVVIMDFLGLGMKNVTSLTPSYAMRLLSFIQEAMPFRLKEVHMVNQPMLFDMVFQIFKPFIKEKLNKRMFFHGKKMDSLHKHIDPNFLPADYGGSKPAINYGSKDWYHALLAVEDHIKEWNSFGFVNK